VGPSNWKSDFDDVRSLDRWPGFRGKLIPIPVFLSGNIPLHTYKSIFIPLLNRIQPDAIYVHHEAYGLATAQIYFANWLQARKPIGFYSAQNIYKRYPPPFRYLERFVYNQSSFAFPITSNVLNVLQAKKYEGPATVLPLGIDSSLYHPQDKIPPHELNAAPNDIIIGYVGRLVELKGLSTLLRALNRIRDLPWHLVLIGTGPHRTNLQTQARNLGIDDRIAHLGYVPHDEIPRYLSTLDLLVLPSETQPDAKEQFGRVIIEALACGTPVLGSDSGEIPHLIEDTGGGLIFHERDPVICGQQLSRLIQHAELRTKLSEVGRESVLKKYTHAALAEKFAATIDQAITSHHRG